MDAVDTPCYDTQCYLYFSDRLLSQYTFQVLGASGSHQARLGYICVYRTQVNLLLSDQLSQYTFQEVCDRLPRINQPTLKLPGSHLRRFAIFVPTKVHLPLFCTSCPNFAKLHHFFVQYGPIIDDPRI